VRGIPDSINIVDSVPPVPAINEEAVTEVGVIRV